MLMYISCLQLSDNQYDIYFFRVQTSLKGCWVTDYRSIYKKRRLNYQPPFGLCDGFFRLFDIRIQFVPFRDSRKNAHCDYFVTQFAQVSVALVQSSLFFSCTVQSSAVATVSSD